MAWNIGIQHFKTHFQDGGARPNLFIVEITHPSAVSVADGEKISYTCRAASVPAMTLGTIEVPFQGRKVKVAGDRTFAEWTATVLNDESWITRAALEQWNNQLNLHNDNIREANEYLLDQYKSSVKIHQLNKKGEEIMEYELVGAYPSEVSAIELAWDTTDTIEEYTVTFQYDYFVTRIGTALAAEPVT